MDFIDWLRKTISDSNLSYNEIGRRGGISHARISQVLAGENPGADFCIGIARGLALDPVTVLRIAGILPPAPGSDTDNPDLAAAWALLQKLTPVELDVVARELRGLTG